MAEIERRKDLREHDTKRRARKVYKNGRGKIIRKRLEKGKIIKESGLKSKKINFL